MDLHARAVTTDQLCVTLASHAHLTLLLDLDGTLIPFAARPEDANLDVGAEPQQLPHGVRWVAPDDVVEAVRGLAFPPGRVHAFVHGETGMVKQLRDHLTADRGLTREQLSISGYWRRGLHEDAFQAEKRATAAAAR